MMNLQGKNVILLGGLNGLGLAMARNLLMKRIAVSIPETLGFQ